MKQNPKSGGSEEFKTVAIKRSHLKFAANLNDAIDTTASKKSGIASVTPSSFTQSDSVADCVAFKVARGFNGADDREFIAELKFRHW